jgi:hypothetical protein
MWGRSELNQREESPAVGGFVSSIPASMRAFYGTDAAVTLNVGVHFFGMWMLDGDLRPMRHVGM